MVNGGASPLAKALVDYPDDDDDDSMEGKPILTPETPLTPDSEKENSSPVEVKGTPERRLEPSPEIKSAAELELQHPPERLSEKRRRQEGDDEDELDKLSTGIKRRNSTASNSSAPTPPTLRKRKGTFLRSKQGPDSIAATSTSPEQTSPAEGRKTRKIAITLNSIKKEAAAAAAATAAAKENTEHIEAEGTKDDS
jgi:protein phosphatase-4 regulatory subunit 3